MLKTGRASHGPSLTNLIWRPQSAHIGILVLFEGFITPRPRRGAGFCPLVWATPFMAPPPRLGRPVGLGNTGAGPVGAGGLGAAGFGTGANAAAGGLGAGARLELTIGTEAGGGIGAEASTEGAPGAGPLFWKVALGAATGLNPGIALGPAGAQDGVRAPSSPVSTFLGGGHKNGPPEPREV
ncbi:hypothetical protein E2C01_009122 [Portunus trituberculatus]|uniref:Uncharacterized protein n=1 Tax=Portunus trituberculatus TaxID=210409 RepID=A0A5B7D4K4_PORTR|nr:hypothetical protein [Portunus trituberculatus]